MSCSISTLAILLWYCISLLVTYSSSIASSTTTTTTISGNETDRLSLLAIKAQIHDPLGVTSSWNDSVPLCQWRGIKCARRHPRVTELHLGFQRLGGFLSPHIGNLSFLRLINLTANNFYGEIPPEVGRLFRLEIMTVGNNSFHGTIPANLSHCSNIKAFSASHNNLVGEIPAELGNLLKLQLLFIGNNYLTGQLPASIGNLSAVKEFFVRHNGLQGRIPDTCGQLNGLVTLDLSFNQFSGMVPPSIYNISSLERFSVLNNRLHGSLPHNLGFTLPSLKRLIMAENNFTGPLPVFLFNASKLEELDISENRFSGKVSVNFNGLKNLWWLDLTTNTLGSRAANDLDFVTTLTNCSILETLGLTSNLFGGELPNSISNLSTSMTAIVMGGNQISGTIPSGISRLVNLNEIAMELNQLTGNIPHAIGNLKNLEVLALHGNYFSGKIPPSLGNLSILNLLELEDNNLQGSIPPALGKCQKLIQLRLQHNRLTGIVPQQIFSILTLSIVLNLSNNFLTGSFPLEVSNLKNLVALDISGNQFSGEIPDTLGSCISLENLYLGKNSFYGRIPRTLSALRSIKRLDLSLNNLSGPIPKYFETFSFLEYLNISYNHFEGEVPTKGVFSNATKISLIGNKKLCGGLAELHLLSCRFKESKKKLTSSLKLILIACAILGFLLLSSSILFCWYKYAKTKKDPSSAFSFMDNSSLKVSYQQLLKATDGFSSTNLIGQGSFGHVYKGILNQNQDRNIIAVKVFNLQHRGASKSFMAECETLRNIRHRNLVKIISACSSVDFQGNAFKALVYEFMPNGSLEMWLHLYPEANGQHGEPRGLNFLQRLNIAIDVAYALDYLHKHCHGTIVHRDLKPNNVLLDDDMVAHVGDFGLARFFPQANNKFSANQTSTLGIKGTIGYAAPEYGMGNEATAYGDVFSYGILLLEMFTRKRPTDEMFKDDLTLHDYTKMALPEQVIQIADPLLLARAIVEEEATVSRNPRQVHMERDEIQECLISVLRIGVACSVESPNNRMDISDAASELCLTRDKLLRTGTQDKKELLSVKFGSSCVNLG